MDTPDDDTRYYTFDISLLPPRAIWRSLRHSASWPNRIPLFIYFLGCKIVGARNPIYGLARPMSLIEVDWDSLPAEAKAALESTADVCREAGFHLVALHRTQVIGARR